VKIDIRHIIFLITIALLWLPGMSVHAQMNTDRITAIGRNALYFDDYVLSMQYFNQVIRLKPHLSEPYLLRAIAKINLQDYQGALRDCNSAIERNPFQPGAYYTRGYVLAQMNRLDEAEQDFTEALRFSPENKTYLILRADIRSRNRKYALAMEDIDYLLRKEPKAPSLLFEKGVICMAMEDTLGALHQFEQTTQYDSQNPSNWSALGLVHLMLEDDNEALADLTRSINLGSKWAGDYINRGIIFYRKHNYRGAMSDYDKAVSLAPRDAQCYYNRGILRQELGDWNRALDDFNQAIYLDPERTEMYYQRGTVLLQLRQWKDAASDFQHLIDSYPYFLPAYYLAAQAKTALGEGKAAFEYRKRAMEMEEKKKDPAIQAALAADSVPNTDVHLAQSQPQKKDRRKEFSSATAQNRADEVQDNTYSSDTRGSVQKRYTDVVNEGNIMLSYYAQNNSLRRTNYFHYMVEQINSQNLLPARLQFTPQELALSAEMVSQHFEQISLLSQQIEHAELHNNPMAHLYFARAMEFALVQDYISAIEDITRAIIMQSDMHILYFCRANWRYKQLRINQSIGNEINTLEYEMILRDYDYLILHCPDFAFAPYNKANLLCEQREYQAALPYYTQAIAIDPDFAEAYFNRGLTRIYLDQVDDGIRDLSRAGELGIYQAYNLITRFQ